MLKRARSWKIVDGVGPADVVGLVRGSQVHAEDAGETRKIWGVATSIASPMSLFQRCHKCAASPERTCWAHCGDTNGGRELAECLGREGAVVRQPAKGVDVSPPGVLRRKGQLRFRKQGQRR